MYEKPKKKKKRMHHPDSIMQKKDGRCYMCKLEGDWSIKVTEEHHAFPGVFGRKKSEELGLKVYLCAEHHRTGKDAAHRNQNVMRFIQKKAQREYEKTHSREEWMDQMKRNFL